jgi:hypothetical protein
MACKSTSRNNFLENLILNMLRPKLIYIFDTKIKFDQKVLRKYFEKGIIKLLI